MKAGYHLQRVPGLEWDIGKNKDARYLICTGDAGDQRRAMKQQNAWQSMLALLYKLIREEEKVSSMRHFSLFS
jgi:hypothetical protein